MAEKNINNDQIRWAEVEDMELFDAPETAAEYWRIAIEVVNAWSQYRAKAKLYFNATHDETRHMVWHIIVDKYGGNVDRLLDHEGELSENVNRKLLAFEGICLDFGVNKISRQWLYDNLKNSKDYQKLRQKCLRRLQVHKPAESLRDLI